jgi:AbrB family looped-hinge helix DNA binding protein
VLLDALGWSPGDRLSLDLLDSTIVLRRTPTGPHHVNGRGQIFLPAGIRALLGIADNDRVVLIAAPAADTLIVHPAGVILSLIAGFHDSLPGASDAR